MPRCTTCTGSVPPKIKPNGTPQTLYLRTVDRDSCAVYRVYQLNRKDISYLYYVHLYINDLWCTAGVPQPAT